MRGVPVGASCACRRRLSEPTSHREPLQHDRWLHKVDAAAPSDATRWRGPAVRQSGDAAARRRGDAETPYGGAVRRRRTATLWPAAAAYVSGLIRPSRRMVVARVVARYFRVRIGVGSRREWGVL